MKLLISTNNAHKADELRTILEHEIADIDVVMMKDVVKQPFEVEESGRTLEENAYIKATSFFDLTGLPCVADDTGLEIDALNGAPGVYTARFAGETASYSDNVDLVLSRLQSIPVGKRIARFRCVICYHDGLRTLFAEGVCEGQIALTASGDAGFGYDPVFIPQGHSTTFAEMDAEAKNRISHRGLALVDFASKLKTMIA